MWKRVAVGGEVYLKEVDNDSTEEQATEAPKRPGNRLQTLGQAEKALDCTGNHRLDG